MPPLLDIPFLQWPAKYGFCSSLFLQRPYCRPPLWSNPNRRIERQDKKYIVHRTDDLIWSFYLITLFPLDHLHTVGCIFEILTNTNIERQIQIQKGKDNIQLQSTNEDLNRSPSCLAYPHTPCLPVIIYIFKDGKMKEKKHSNAFVNVSVRLLSMLILPHNLLRHSSV